METGRIGQGAVLFALSLCVGAWAQGAQGARGRGNGRGARGAETAPAAAPAQAAVPPAAAAPAAGRGRGGGGAPAGPNDLYDFSAGAGEFAPLRSGPPVESQQQITVAGQPLAYTVRVGTMPINNATSGEPEAHLFYTYYARSGAGARPLAFLFGGAPGASASWLELGGFGPKHLDLASDGSAGLPPYRWSDNPQTLLADADLVFVDPVGTGYSRAESPALNAKFASPLYDAASLGEFVRSFLGQYDRWNSPRFLIGEDFGTGRVANLASYLALHQLPVNGVAILSTAPASDATAGDEEYMTLLPSEIMTSWYHKQLAGELQSLTAAQMADRARQFASREYLHALYKGDRITEAERSKVLADMARLTGLSQSFLANNDLRVPKERYDAELLREQHEELTPSDTRFSTYLRPGGGGRGGRGGFGAAAAGPAADVHEELMANGFLSGYEQYLRQDLKFSN